MIAPSSASPAPTTVLARTADQPRLVEHVVGRLLELMVISVENVRARLHRLSVH